MMNQQDQAQLTTPGVLVGPSGQAVVTAHPLVANSVIVQAASFAAINNLVGGKYLLVFGVVLRAMRFPVSVFWPDVMTMTRGRLFCEVKFVIAGDSLHSECMRRRTWCLHFSYKVFVSGIASLKLIELS